MSIQTQLKLKWFKFKDTIKIHMNFEPVFISAVVIFIFMLAYFVGYSNGFSDATNIIMHSYKAERPMCAIKDTEIRTEPSGFIISKVKQTDLVWVINFDVPFSMVWYYDGKTWLYGTMTSVYLTPCEFMSNYKEITK